VDLKSPILSPRLIQSSFTHIPNAELELASTPPPLKVTFSTLYIDTSVGLFT